jgi:hypothetical protein
MSVETHPDILKLLGLLDHHPMKMSDVEALGLGDAIAVCRGQSPPLACRKVAGPIDAPRLAYITDAGRAFLARGRLAESGERLEAPLEEGPTPLRVRPDEREKARPRRKPKAMRSAAKETTETSEPTEPIKPPPHPTYDEAVHKDVIEIKELIRASIPNATPSVALTPDDLYILAVLAAASGKALTFNKIITESVRMEQADRSKVRRLSESTIRGRVRFLEAQGLVARPAGTKKKGIAITAKGSEVRKIAVANSTETQRKK